MAIELPLRVPGKIVVPKRWSGEGRRVLLGPDVGWTNGEVSDWKMTASFSSKRVASEGVEEEDLAFLPERNIDATKYPRVYAAALACRVIVTQVYGWSGPEPRGPHDERLSAHGVYGDIELGFHRGSNGFTLTVVGDSVAKSISGVDGVAPDHIMPDGVPAVAIDAEYSLDRLLRALSGGEFGAASLALAYELYDVLNAEDGEERLARWEEELLALERAAPADVDALVAAIAAVSEETSQETAIGVVHAHVLGACELTSSRQKIATMAREVLFAAYDQAPPARAEPAASAQVALHSTIADLPSEAEILATKQRLAEIVRERQIAVPPEVAAQLGIAPAGVMDRLAQSPTAIVLFVLAFVVLFLALTA
ncbi:MAG: hypothetical protein IT381_12595 [Deltaproteobacteria bacterium]|nr:hypothetical protein [Deltaproteobacteria bacterium]